MKINDNEFQVTGRYLQSTTTARKNNKGGRVVWYLKGLTFAQCDKILDAREDTKVTFKTKGGREVTIHVVGPWANPKGESAPKVAAKATKPSTSKPRTSAPVNVESVPMTKPRMIMDLLVMGKSTEEALLIADAAFAS